MATVTVFVLLLTLRLFIVGLKNPIAMNFEEAKLAAMTAVELVTAKVTANVPLPVNFIQFCNLPVAAIDWSRHGRLPSLEELGRINRLKCKCRLDPMLICPVHRCNCQACNNNSAYVQLAQSAFFVSARQD